MAVLETIRVKFGILITALIAVALLGFIVDLNSLLPALDSSSSKSNVGVIGSESISYKEFQNELDKFNVIGEITSGSSVKNDEYQKEINNMTWESFIEKYLFVKNANAAGIYVSDSEMKEILSGNITSGVFTQNPMFHDENGAFSKDKVLQFADYVTSDESGRLMTFWLYLQNTAKNQMYFAKYNSLLNQSNYTNPLMLTNKLAENNTTFDVEFVMLPYGYQVDSTIVVSDAEIKKYYNDHKKFYKQLASRDIEYVVFEINPSAEDIEKANEAIVAVYDEFKSTDRIKPFLSANSDRKFDETWYKAGDLNTVSRKVNDFVVSNGKGKVSGIIEDNGSFFAVRILDVDKESKKQVAILEKKPFASEKTKGAVYATANTFATKANGGYENFKKAAQEEGVFALPVNKMLESAERLGAIDNTKEITRWAFEAGKNDVSGIKTVDNKYFVVAVVTGIHKEGYTPVSEVSSSIKDILYSEKLGQKKGVEVAEKIAGLESMEAIAEALGTTVSTKEDIAFQSMNPQGLDPKFVGAASVAEEGVINGPVVGNVGVYVYKVTGRETGAFYTEDDAKNMDAQMSYYASQMLLPTMMDDADVKDNRARFF